MTDPSGRARAVALVAAYAVAVGAPGRRMDAEGDVSFGDTGLHYEESENVIYGRAYVTLALTKEESPEWITAYRRLLQLLNDPAVGGMYDRAGGYFILAEDKEAYFLVRRFDVAKTSPADLIASMDRMKTVAARWTMKWFVEVSEVMHGTRLRPVAPVTVED